MSQVSAALAFLLGMFLQTLLVGLFIPLLIIAGYAQWKKVSKGRKINLVMAFTTVFFGLSITTHWILGMRRAILGALYLPPGMTIDQYFLPPYNTEEIVREGIFQFEIVIGDLIMLYRMYHIYNKSLLACVVPSITTAGLFVIGCGSTNQLRYYNTPADFKANDSWSTACFCITLFNSVFMSGAIILRLWKAQREIAVFDVIINDPIIPRALRVLVESAALWTFFIVADFCAFLARSNLSDTFLNMVSPALGISFCLIIVRLGFMTPEVHEDSWRGSQPSRTSGIVPVSVSQISSVPISLDHAREERDVYAVESESGVELHTIGSKPLHEKQSRVHCVD